MVRGSTLAGKEVKVDNQYLHVVLSDGRMISTPVSWYRELQDATLKQLCRYRFICNGTGIEWPELDYHLSIESMLLINSQKNVA